MPSSALLAGLTSTALAVGVALAAGTAQGAPDATRAKIRNALSAAPPEVARGAAVVDWAEHGAGHHEMPVLRKGGNGFTCLPDDPMTPTNDPQCMNGPAMSWMEAWMARTKPKLSAPGLTYVLQGCTVASNTDPFAMEPAEGRRWIETRAHVMVFPTGKLDRKAYGTNPHRGLPYIRWAGTPYEHLVVPVPAPAR
jgi:hypothetical protein